MTRLEETVLDYSNGVFCLMTNRIDAWFGNMSCLGIMVCQETENLEYLVVFRLPKKDKWSEPKAMLQCIRKLENLIQ